MRAPEPYELEVATDFGSARLESQSRRAAGGHIEFLCDILMTHSCPGSLEEFIERCQLLQCDITYEAAHRLLVFAITESDSFAAVVVTLRSEHHWQETLFVALKEAHLWIMNDGPPWLRATEEIVTFGESLFRPRRG